MDWRECEIRDQSLSLCLLGPGFTRTQFAHDKERGLVELRGQLFASREVDRMQHHFQHVKGFGGHGNFKVFSFTDVFRVVLFLLSLLNFHTERGHFTLVFGFLRLLFGGRDPRRLKSNFASWLFFKVNVEPLVDASLES